MIYELRIIFSVVVCFITLNCHATKIAPASLKELLSESSLAISVNIKKASLSDNKYKVFHSGEEKSYLNYTGTVIDSIKGEKAGKLIEFSSRKPLLINREYFIFLNPSKSGEFIVAQAGFAAFEKAYISFESGIKSGLRVPLTYISMPKNLTVTKGVTKRNEQSSYIWVEWLLFKRWQTTHLNFSLTDKN